MRILFTGASSFTGMWFVSELARAGHEIVMTFQRPEADAYEGLRSKRVEMASQCGRAEFGCSFGDERFLAILQDHGPWDLLCHHAADVRDYKSPEFNVARALASNTNNIRAIMHTLRNHAKANARFLLTGSIFEPGEGAGSEGLPAFSPYGLSKGLTFEMIRHYAAVFNVSLGKFVIPNPFGPYEEPRFTNYLMKTWFAGDTPCVKTPDYVRDNIHVTLLAKAYAQFAQSLASASEGCCKYSPSGYVGSQGDFTRRFASEMQARLDMPCPVDCADQTEFTEPRVRVNTDFPDHRKLGWEEKRAWDEIAEYYQQQYRKPATPLEHP